MGATERLDHRLDLATRVCEPDYVARVLQAIEQVETAPDTATAVRLLQQATGRLGADASIFTSYVRDDVTLASYRYLLACDPMWGVQYANNTWCLDDPWLRFALYNAEVVRAEDLPELSDRQRWVVDAASHFGFRSAVIVPVMTPAAQSRVSVLTLGSEQANYFAGEGYARFRILARSLAMELGDWMHRKVRAELMTQAHISEGDLVLLRHQQQGHNSKLIAAALDTEPKTIDGRFHRLSLRLGTGNRRAALRVAEIYGLI